MLLIIGGIKKWIVRKNIGPRGEGEEWVVLAGIDSVYIQESRYIAE